MPSLSRKVLVLEDEDDVRGYEAAVLRTAGYLVEEAGTIAEAKTALSRQRFDVLISDIGLPDGDGLEMLSHIAAVAPSTRVVICSASTTWDNAVRALHAGAYDFLPKPVNKDAMCSAVKRAVEARRLEEENAILVCRLVEQSSLLEQKVDERTAELRASNVSLAQANRTLEETRDQMVRAEKMASIGCIAAGVAHEINNPIGFINSNLQTLRGYVGELKPLIEDYRRIAPPDPAVEARAKKMDLDFVLGDLETLVRESEDGVKRVVKIVKDLKTFSHSDSSAPESANLNSCIESAVNLSRNETKYCSDVALELGEVSGVRCWPGQITQVLVNLIVNAAHAIKGDGETKKHGAITVRSRTDGLFAIIEVADDGCGIPPEIASRIFDPFFTTKEPGRGTGLGLSLSYEIVERHRGEIRFHSEVGHGTTFEVRVPIAGPDAAVVSNPALSQNREVMNS